jgi:Ca2+-binding RTX toxin-like protein
MFAKLSVITAAVGLVFAAGAPGAHQQDPCFGATPTISGSGQIDGTMADDVILGSDGPDSIRGFGGNDKICAGGGDDEIGGGPGNDEIDGGPGNDQIEGGPGNDTILGGEGDDTIRCGPDNDVADGGPGVNTAERSGFEACESVTNAAPPQTETTPTPHPVTATLSPRQAVPRPVGAKRGAAGRFTATVTATGTGATLRWRLTFKGLTGAARTAHVHQGRPGQTGRVLARLCAPCRSGMSGTTQVIGQPARMALNQGNAYVEIHTKRNPRGEIRGRIVRVSG